MNGRLKKLSHAGKFLFDPDYRFIILSATRFYDSMDDETFVRRKFKAQMGYPLDLDNPKTYNEKIQWLKLFDQKPEYTTMVDKYAAKKYVADIIGEEYIIPTLGVWDKFDDIDFDILPNQFVLKTTHDSGGIFICRDKTKLDINAARKKMNWSLHRNYYKIHREWPYKDVPRRIIAETYMEDTHTRELRDYKIFNFDGVPKIMFVASDRQNKNEQTKFDFFDMDYQHLDIRNGHPNAIIPPDKPKSFDQMVEFAMALSKGIPHLRTDFYEIDGKPYFGELTFSHWSGFVPFNPLEWDYKLGSWITLPDRGKLCK